MGGFDQEEFNNFVIEQGVIGIFPEKRKLKSKRESSFYANWRGPASYVESIRELSKHVLAYAEDEGFDTSFIYGVPEGATKLGTLLQYLSSGDEGYIIADNGLIPISWINEFYQEKLKGNIDDTDCIMGDPNTPLREAAIIFQYLHSSDLNKDMVLPMGRKKPKNYGDPKDSTFVGHPKGKTLLLTYPGEEEYTRILEGFVKKLDFDLEVHEIRDVPVEEIKKPIYATFVEDVTTTGSSSIKKIEESKERGLIGIGVIALTNRMEKTPIPGVDDPELVEEFRKIFEKATNLPYKKAMSVREAFETIGIKYGEMSNALELLPRIHEAVERREDLENEFKVYGVRPLIFG